MDLKVARQNYGRRVRENVIAQIKDKDSQAKKEQFVLKVSMMCALMLAVFGMSFGIIAKSSAIMFDGLICLVSVVLGLLSVITSRYIYKEDDDVFQYGYVRFEPMVNLFKSLILLIVCICAAISAINSIVHGGYTLELGAIVIYTICAFFVCLMIFAYTRFYSKILVSELIGVDKTEWLIDCVLYFGGILAYGCVYIFDPNQEFWFSRYIDPILLMLLSLGLAITPLKILISNLKDLMMVAPEELDEKITNIMDKLSKEYGFKDYDTHTAKSGRFFMIEVNILTSNSNDKVAIGELDLIRDRIEKSLEIPSYRIWLLVSFTANPKWL